MINVIMPMAGRGSRFNKEGYNLPKPLVELNGKPLFWWAANSIFFNAKVKKIIFVILRQHIEKFDIDKAIKNFFPHAELVVIDNITGGSLDTALCALPLIDNELPVVINDCDHAFNCSQLNGKIKEMEENTNILGFLCNFNSNLPAYSYAEYNSYGQLIRTIEKKVISNKAIAGAYVFRNKSVIENNSSIYKKITEYNETYISGLYNVLIKSRGCVKGIDLDFHVAFGTPEELNEAKYKMDLLKWEIL